MVRRTTFEAASSSSTRAASSSGGASGGAAASSSSGPSALPAAPKLQEWQLGHSSAGNVVMVVETKYGNTPFTVKECVVVVHRGLRMS